MESRLHLILIGVIAVYTVVLALLVARNVHAMRSIHACSDLSGPLAHSLAIVLESKETHPLLFQSLHRARFHAVRILVFDDTGDVLFDSESPVVEKRPVPPRENQRDVRDAFEAAESTAKSSAFTSTQLLLHRPSGSGMAHVAGARCANGTLVVTEAMAT